MAAFSGNLLLGAIRLGRGRLIRISSVGGGGSLCCYAEGRGYSRSSPLKYVPKNSRQTNQNISQQYEESSVEGTDAYFPAADPESRSNGLELNMRRVGAPCPTNPSMTFLDVEPQNDDQATNSSFDECLISESEEELDVNLPSLNDECIELSDPRVKNSSHRVDEIPMSEQRQDAEKMAIQLLISRAFTASELKKKLIGKRFSVHIVDEVIIDLQCRGIINDSFYAEAYCQSRWSSSSWGPGKIKQGLLKKGVTAADADKAIELVFKNGNDHDSGTGMSRLPFDQLYLQASKQWQRSIGVPLETRKSRIVRWLQYRGFSWAVVGDILKKLQAGSAS